MEGLIYFLEKNTEKRPLRFLPVGLFFITPLTWDRTDKNSYMMV